MRFAGELRAQAVRGGTARLSSEPSGDRECRWGAQVEGYIRKENGDSRRLFAGTGTVGPVLIPLATGAERYHRASAPLQSTGAGVVAAA